MFLSPDRRRKKYPTVIEPNWIRSISQSLTPWPYGLVLTKSYRRYLPAPSARRERGGREGEKRKREKGGSPLPFPISFSLPPIPLPHFMSTPATRLRRHKRYDHINSLRVATPSPRIMNRSCKEKSFSYLLHVKDGFTFHNLRLWCITYFSGDIIIFLQ